MQFRAALVFASVLTKSAATFHVSPEGQLSSLASARDAIRKLRAQGDSEPHRVLVRGGWYPMTETLVFTSADSNVIYEAHPGERPVISGGRRIEGWTKGSDGVRAAPAGWSFRQFFVSGRRAQRAHAH